MRYISLGRHCATSYNIKKYINSNVPTQFFDWSRTDFKCVLGVLTIKNIEEIFNIENIIVDNVTHRHENDLCMTLNNFVNDNLCLLYHHDIKYKEYTEPELNSKLIEFIDKYKRRYDRLIELIKMDEKLCFIYHILNCDFDYDDTNIFNTILISINKNIDYILILLVEDKDDTNIYSIHTNYVKINLNFFVSKEKRTWENLGYDWEKIFKLINTTQF